MGNDDGREIQLASKDYDVSGKIMLIAIVALFVIIIIMLCLHAYIRWHLHRARRREHLRRSHRPHFVFTVPPSAFTTASRGLRRSVISSLPVFTVSPSSLPAECAVCLSEFQNGETGRVLPKCNHTFHTDCIDMWFHSHSTCPLCRTLVEPPCRFQTSPELVISVTEPGSSSEPGEGEVVNRSGPEAASSSSVRVEEGESGCETQSAIRSPVSRMLSFKKILSREKKGNVSGCVAE